MSEGLVPEFLLVFRFLLGFPLDVPDERGTRRPWLEEGTPISQAWPKMQPGSGPLDSGLPLSSAARQHLELRGIRMPVGRWRRILGSLDRGKPAQNLSSATSKQYQKLLSTWGVWFKFCKETCRCFVGSF